MTRLRFSQRMGLAPIRVDIQRDSMSDELRNSLWNLIYADILTTTAMKSYSRQHEVTVLVTLAQLMWRNFYKEPIDTVPGYSEGVIAHIKSRFFGARWVEVYDTVEWFANLSFVTDEIVCDFNAILLREKSAFRLIDKILVPIVDEVEIASLEESLSDARFADATKHLRRALELHSDRTTPDYRNSIKESVSAVESMARFLTNDPKATLGQALKHIEERFGLHAALKSSWSTLYGYTSDEGGIRHALTNGNEPDEPLSRLMLVSCAAFVNYLKMMTPIS